MAPFGSIGRALVAAGNPGPVAPPRPDGLHARAVRPQPDGVGAVSAQVWSVNHDVRAVTGRPDAELLFVRSRFNMSLSIDPALSEQEKHFEEWKSFMAE